MSSNHSIIDIKNLSYRYERETALKDINLSLAKGSFVALIGPNGSGKSTLLKLILGLLKLQSGEIHLFGEKITQFKNWEWIGFVSQKANSFNSGFPATVQEVVASGLTKRLGLFTRMKKKDTDKVRETIDSVGLSKFINRNIGELSGGQQQRVFIARALISEPKLLILDEPTVGVDAQNIQEFYKLLEDLNKNLGITLLLVTHDMETVSDKVTHVACLNKSLYFYGRTTEFEQLKADELSQLYGHHLQMLSHEHHFEGAGQ